jgi:colicin import membrane protein
MAQQKAEQAERAKEEKHRQEQVLIEQQQQKERDRQRELEKTKKELADARKQKEKEKARLEQLMDLEKDQKPVKTVAQNVAPADKPVTGNNGAENSLAAQYAAAIQNAALNNWVHPADIQVVCDVDIKQIPGGELLDVHVVNPCSADGQTRDTIEQAIRRAAPLPYKGFESVFRREIVFTFCYPQGVCPK